MKSIKRQGTSGKFSRSSEMERQPALTTKAVKADTNVVSEILASLLEMIQKQELSQDWKVDSSSSCRYIIVLSTKVPWSGRKQLLTSSSGTTKQTFDRTSQLLAILPMLHIIIGYFKECNSPLYFRSVDNKKAFVNLSRDDVWKLLGVAWYPQKGNLLDATLTY